MKIHRVKSKNFKDCNHVCDVLLASGFHPVVVQNFEVFSDEGYHISFVQSDKLNDDFLPEIPKEIEPRIFKTTEV